MAALLSRLTYLRASGGCSSNWSICTLNKIPCILGLSYTSGYKRLKLLKKIYGLEIREIRQMEKVLVVAPLDDVTSINGSYELTFTFQDTQIAATIEIILNHLKGLEEQAFLYTKSLKPEVHLILSYYHQKYWVDELRQDEIVGISITIEQFLQKLIIGYLRCSLWLEFRAFCCSLALISPHASEHSYRFFSRILGIMQRVEEVCFLANQRFNFQSPSNTNSTR